jgi:hypothetical protein
MARVQTSRPLSAILFGATGMVGEGVLYTALQSDAVDSVLVIGRRECGVTHNKLTEIIHDDFFAYAKIEKHLFPYNACFFCLGVSSIGMKEAAYTRLTYDLTMKAAATLAQLNPQMTFCYVSGAGTDSTAHGKRMWARVKGKTENDLQKLGFKAVYNFRPGFIRPIPGLKNAFTASKIVGTAYPLLNAIVPNYVCTLDDLGSAMIHVSRYGYPSPILENIDIAVAAG